MSPRLTWSNLIPGLIALGLVVAFAAAVIVFAGVGRIRGETLRLHVVADQARGLMKGSDVWVGGQRVGRVRDIGFLPPGADTSARIVVVLDVTTDGAVQIRRDSDVQIRAGGNVIGPIVVYITAGTPTSPRVADGDTLRADAQSDFEDASAKLAAATVELQPMMAEAKVVMARLRDTSGTIGAALSGGGATKSELTQLGSRLSALSSQVSAFGARPESAASLIAATQRAMARVDSVRALLAAPHTSYGRFKRDSTLGDVIAGVRDELASLGERMGSEEGTLGRWSRDSAIVRQVTNAQREMAALVADVRRRPSRYIAF